MKGSKGTEQICDATQLTTNFHTYHSNCQSIDNKQFPSGFITPLQKVCYLKKKTIVVSYC